MTARKGIILAAGSGTRLAPVTLGLSKQLLPVYDKPMSHYPLSVPMLAGIREVAIVTTPQGQAQSRRMLGHGSQWGLALSYVVQPSPDGLVQAFVLTEEFLAGAPSVLVLGDNLFLGGNLFFGQGLAELLGEAAARPAGTTVLGYRVVDPERYGVVAFDSDGKVTRIVEKPSEPPSPYAITGLYFVDGTAPERARAIRPSPGSELEIVDLLAGYLCESAFEVVRMGRGYAWVDTGTHSSLLDAGNFVRTLQIRQGMLVGSPDGIAFHQGWISPDDLEYRAGQLSKNDYGRRLSGIVREARQEST